MEHADSQCKHHRYVVASFYTEGCILRFGQVLESALRNNLAVEEQVVDAREQCTQIHAKRCAEEEAYDKCSDAQGHDNRSKAIKHVNLQFALVGKPSEQHEQYTVTCIAHTHREEQQVEWSQNRRRVKLAIRWPTVHAGKDLKEFGELVVVQFHRCSVTLNRIFNLVICVKFIKDFVEFGSLFRRAEAFHQA